MSTLVIHTGGIGDFILACPSIAALRESDDVTLAGGWKGRLELAVTAGIATKAHDLDSIDFSSLLTNASEKARNFLSSFTRVVVWMKDDGALESALRSCGVSKIDIYPGLPPKNWARHASEYYLSCLGFENRESFRLSVTPTEETGDIVIHPGSGGASKNWEVANFLRLAEAFKELGHSVAWCVGPAEEEDAQFIARLPGMRIAGLDLVTLARRLSGARLFVGNDSGIGHLAAAAGCKTLSIFGPTDATVWAPRGEVARVCARVPFPSFEEVRDTACRMLEGP